VNEESYIHVKVNTPQTHPASGESLSPPLGGGVLATLAPDLLGNRPFPDTVRQDRCDAVQVSGTVEGHGRNGNALRLVQNAAVNAIIQQLKYA
jgi:hypothetical protein